MANVDVDAFNKLELLADAGSLVISCTDLMDDINTFICIRLLPPPIVVMLIKYLNYLCWLGEFIVLVTGVATITYRNK